MKIKSYAQPDIVITKKRKRATIQSTCIDAARNLIRSSATRGRGPYERGCLNMAKKKKKVAKKAAKKKGGKKRRR
jgi:hypothetical protein